MGKSAQTPNMFNALEEPMLSEAFARAWRVLIVPLIEGDPCPIALQSKIASAIMIAASEGIMDPELLAKMAVERCSSIQSQPLSHAPSAEQPRR